MLRFKLTIEYDGLRYHGWAHRTLTPTIEGELLQALGQVLGNPRSDLHGAGQTEAGSHALAQVAHLDAIIRQPTESVRRALNAVLPDDITILELSPATASFHARHDAISRSYLYQIATRRTVFGRHLSWWLPEPPDPTIMKTVADLFGRHPHYQPFAADPADRDGAKPLLEEVAVRCNDSLILVRFRGSDALHQVVRPLVNLLVEAGLGRIAVTDVDAMLAANDMPPATPAVPVTGLFLEKVLYRDDPGVPEMIPVVRTRWC